MNSQSKCQILTCIFKLGKDKKMNKLLKSIKYEALLLFSKKSILIIYNFSLANHFFPLLRFDLYYLPRYLILFSQALAFYLPDFFGCLELVWNNNFDYRPNVWFSLQLVWDPVVDLRSDSRPKLQWLSWGPLLITSAVIDCIHYNLLSTCNTKRF